MRIVHRRRPGRSEVDPAALALIARHGAQILATARRYSSTPEDAEDAYQRGLEILLTKAPTTSEDELVPWLKTVVIRTFDAPCSCFAWWLLRNGWWRPGRPGRSFTCLRTSLRVIVSRSCCCCRACASGCRTTIGGGSL